MSGPTANLARPSAETAMTNTVLDFRPTRHGFHFAKQTLNPRSRVGRIPGRVDSGLPAQRRNAQTRVIRESQIVNVLTIVACLQFGVCHKRFTGLFDSRNITRDRFKYPALDFSECRTDFDHFASVSGGNDKALHALFLREPFDPHPPLRGTLSQRERE